MIRSGPVRSGPKNKSGTKNPVRSGPGQNPGQKIRSGPVREKIRDEKSGPVRSDIIFFSFFEGLQASGGSSSFFLWNFQSNAVRIMSGDPFLTLVMAIFIKTYILYLLNCVIPMVEKSVKNYIEWYFQSAQRLNFSRLYAGIMIIHCIHCIHCLHCIHWFHTLGV